MNTYDSEYLDGGLCDAQLLVGDMEELLVYLENC